MMSSHLSFFLYAANHSIIVTAFLLSNLFVAVVELTTGDFPFFLV
jgi:hypothetical protein